MFYTEPGNVPGRKRKSNMTKDDKLYIRVSTDMKKQLQVLANKEKRTLSDYVALILERELEKANPTGGGSAGKE
jgi:uncharacterized protein (DUF1778 family)